VLALGDDSRDGGSDVAFFLVKGRGSPASFGRDEEKKVF